MSTFATSVLPVKYHAIAFYAGLAIVCAAALLFLAYTPQAQGLAIRGWPKVITVAAGAVFVVAAGWWWMTPTKTISQFQAAAKIKSVEGGRFAPGQDVKFRDLLFIFEFPGDAAIGAEQVHVGPLVGGTYAEFITMQNFERRVSYNVIHIPENAVAENASLKILEDLDSLRTGQTRPIKREYGDEQRIVGERLPFSDQIYIYHEPNLSEEQKVRIWKAYKNHGLIVTFRGPEYIANMWKRHGPRGEM